VIACERELERESRELARVLETHQQREQLCLLHGRVRGVLVVLSRELGRSQPGSIGQQQERGQDAGRHLVTRVGQHLRTEPNKVIEEQGHSTVTAGGCLASNYEVVKRFDAVAAGAAGAHRLPRSALMKLWLAFVGTLALAARQAVSGRPQVAHRGSAGPAGAVGLARRRMVDGAAAVGSVATAKPLASRSSTLAPPAPIAARNTPSTAGAGQSLPDADAFALMR